MEETPLLLRVESSRTLPSLFCTSSPLPKVDDPSGASSSPCGLRHEMPPLHAHRDATASPCAGGSDAANSRPKAGIQGDGKRRTPDGSRRCEEQRGLCPRPPEISRITPAAWWTPRRVSYTILLLRPFFDRRRREGGRKATREADVHSTPCMTTDSLGSEPRLRLRRQGRLVFVGCVPRTASSASDPRRGRQQDGA